MMPLIRMSPTSLWFKEQENGHTFLEICSVPFDVHVVMDLKQLKQLREMIEDKIKEIEKK